MYASDRHNGQRNERMNRRIKNTSLCPSIRSFVLLLDGVWHLWNIVFVCAMYLVCWICVVPAFEVTAWREKLDTIAYIYGELSLWWFGICRVQFYWKCAVLSGRVSLLQSQIYAGVKIASTLVIGSLIFKLQMQHCKPVADPKILKGGGRQFISPVLI